MGKELNLIYETTESVGAAVVTRKFTLENVDSVKASKEDLVILLRGLKKADQEDD